VKYIFKMVIIYLAQFVRMLGRVCDEINSYWFSFQFKACGEKFSVRTSSVIYGPENITIGNNFLSMGNLYLYCRNGELLVGDNVALNTNVQIGASQGRIIIGNNVIIGPNVVIRCANHITTATGLIRAQDHQFGIITIEDDVWIGTNSVITSNVTLAKGTVFGAGTVFTRSTEPCSIVGGVPARKISQRN
jgi:galactoside O-acetyltransferase